MIKRILLFPVKLIAVTLAGVLFALAIQIILALAILLIGIVALGVLILTAILPLTYTYAYLIGKDKEAMNRVIRKK